MAFIPVGQATVTHMRFHKDIKRSAVLPTHRHPEPLATARRSVERIDTHGCNGAARGNLKLGVYACAVLLSAGQLGARRDVSVYASVGVVRRESADLRADVSV